MGNKVDNIELVMDIHIPEYTLKGQEAYIHYQCNQKDKDKYNI